jgi:hypothetical protein
MTLRKPPSLWFAPVTIRDRCNSIATTFSTATTMAVDAPGFRSLGACAN